MKKINILKNNRDFNRIIDTYKANKYKDFVIYIERTNDELYHFGISVGKKIGNAVTRNKYKRRIRAIIDKKNYQKGINCIIILRKSILDRDYIEIENSLLKAFKDLKITKE
ncbi:MAG: ribonuclease P protein component [Bacilli bacterium]|jgi:ribonuclease P protein component|nr:ribonuclease P protein component [Bacilli bacterium]